ncbi:hypothetical protein [Burkholderia contaminans]|uniref:hypothetical protein n=1 Tax=Burkholderia contaminans TaxID=488447 RepID=UPI000F587DC0|nr:hypothetical protein [Burkholderia contaminans]RQT38361.1 hypothetical protein DF036_06770 [Burkholderia contaminans]
MKKVWQLIEAGFALCALGLVFAFLVYAFKAHSDGAAAWVQAVGSVAAIWAAYKISDREAATQRKNAKEEAAAIQAQRCEAVGKLMENTASLCYRLSISRFDYGLGYFDVGGYRSSDFTFAIKSLEAIDLMSLQSPELVHGVIGMVNETRAAQQLMDEALKRQVAPRILDIKKHCEDSQAFYADALILSGMEPNELYVPYLRDERFQEPSDDEISSSLQ